jgi:hypothetical protein
VEELGAQRASARERRSRWEGKILNQRSMRGFKGSRSDSTPSAPGPPCQREFCPCARTLAKQPPTRGSPRFPQDVDLQSLSAVMMERSRLSRPRDARAHNCAHITTTTITTLTKRPKATTATNTNKRSRASFKLTHELGGYIRRMRSRAPPRT